MAETVVRAEEEAARNTAILRVAEPTAAAQNAKRAVARPLWVGLTAATIIPIPIRTPFPYIAVHVVYAKFVWGLLPHRMRLGAAVVHVPSH